MHDSGKLDDNPGSTDSQTSGRIVANVANELKMPLAAMSEGHKHIMTLLKEARASLVKIPGVGDKLLADLEEAQCTLESTANLSHFMKMSINRCIEYSHIKESHKLSPNLVSVSLADALRLPADCVASIDPAHRLQVLPLPSTMCTHIIADVQWLQENLLCLLSNAVKYSTCENVNVESPANSTTVHTTLSLSLRTSASLMKEFSLTAVSPTKISPTLHSSPLCAEDRMMLLVECEDSGIGLSEEAMAQLFSPAKIAARLAAGTGLGLLSLAKRMEALNGHCGVRARRDGRPGCLFWFAFPYIPDELTADLVSQHRPVHNTNTNSSHHAHINHTNLAHGEQSQGQGQSTTEIGAVVNGESAEEEDLPSQDVLSSTLQNVLPSPMLFVPDEKADKFNSYAPFPVYAKRLSSRSLRSAMSNLPTTTSFSTSNTAEVHTPIGKWESDSSPSYDALGASGELQALTPHSSGGQGGTVPGSSVVVGGSSREFTTSTSGPLTTSTVNMFSRSNSANNTITTSNTTSNTTTSAVGTSRSTKGRSLILSLPTEESNKRSFPSLDSSGGVVTSGVYGAGVGGVYGVSSVCGVNVCGLPLPPRTNSISNTTTDLNTSTTTTTFNTTTTTTNTTTSTAEPPATLVHAGTPPLPLPLSLPRVPFTPPRASSSGLQGISALSRTVEPSPASSTGTPQRATVENGWTPDVISMIRTYIYTVLLVEDTPMILKMTSNLLRSQGFDVTTAKNGAEAFALIQAQRFDVVLMDLQMPVLDGLEAARRIRAYEAANNVTEPLFLIAVSANSNPMIVVETLGAGYNNYIEKPFTVVQFQDVLSKYLMKKYYAT